MRIFEENNGQLYVTAVSETSDGKDVEGHLYYVNTGPFCHVVNFQQGGVVANGVNGVTSEALLTIIIHRTKFLDSKFPCPENKEALLRLEKALIWLNQRTANRKARGVEGTEVI